MDLRYAILLWTTRICAGAALLVGILLLMPAFRPLRKGWYRLALWIAVGAYGVREATIRLVASGGNIGYFIPVPLLGCLLMIEIVFACYMAGVVRRAAAVVLLSIGLLLLGLVLADPCLYFWRAFSRGHSWTAR